MNYLFVDLDRTFINCNSFSRELRFFIKQTGFLHSLLKFSRMTQYSRLSIKHFIHDQNLKLDYSKCINYRVLELIDKYKSRGYRVLLTTAAVEESARYITNTYDCFDEVIGSSDEVNLKGRKKLIEIRNRIGSESFIYIGDSKQDFVIFESSISSILISRSQFLAFIAKIKFGKKVEIFAGERCTHGRWQ
jgi:phosphoserine phosphatase